MILYIMWSILYCEAIVRQDAKFNDLIINDFLIAPPNNVSQVGGAYEW